MSGRVHSVHRGSGGVPNQRVDALQVTLTHVVGDAYAKPEHHGPPGHPDQVVCLFALEVYEALRADRFAVGPGSFAENITTAGLPLDALADGSVLHIGDDLVVEVTKTRIPCRTLTPLDPRLPHAVRGRSGKYGRVLQAGLTRAGDPIRLAC